jgi:hypothetical protein
MAAQNPGASRLIRNWAAANSGKTTQGRPCTCEINHITLDVKYANAVLQNHSDCCLQFVINSLHQTPHSPD